MPQRRTTTPGHAPPTTNAPPARVAAAVLALVLGAAPALARQAGASEGLESLIDALDLPAWEDRQRATAALATRDDFQLDALVRALGRDDLSPEQRTRLRGAAENRFLSLPAAGLGVQFAGGERVTLQRIIPNFPAAELLRAGDVIVEIQGERVESTNAVRAAILGHLPGETLPMTIGRVGENGLLETLELPIPLGAYADLGNPETPPEALRRAGFAWRVDRAVSRDDALVIGSGVGVREWLAAEGLWPPPDPDTPVGEIDIAIGDRDSASRHLRIAGQAEDLVPGDVLSRGGTLTRSRRIARVIGFGTGASELEEIVASYRITVLQLASIDRQLLELSGQGDRAAPRVANLRRERTEQFTLLRQFVDYIEAADDAPAEDDAAADE